MKRLKLLHNITAMEAPVTYSIYNNIISAVRIQAAFFIVLIRNRESTISNFFHSITKWR